MVTNIYNMVVKEKESETGGTKQCRIKERGIFNPNHAVLYLEYSVYRFFSSDLF